MKPTEKQISTLRKFRISESIIQQMDFEDASKKLSELIDALKKKQASKPQASSSTKAPTESQGEGSHYIAKAPSALPPLDDAWVEKNIEIAISLAKRKLAIHPELIDISQSLVSEIAHERFSIEVTKRIQESKVENIAKGKAKGW